MFAMILLVTVGLLNLTVGNVAIGYLCFGCLFIVFPLALEADLEDEDD